jgi:hypothetical protein
MTTHYDYRLPKINARPGRRNDFRLVKVGDVIEGTADDSTGFSITPRFTVVGFFGDKVMATANSELAGELFHLVDYLPEWR